MNELEQFLRDATGCLDEEYTPEATMDDLDMNDLDLIELCCMVEDEFDIEVDDSRIKEDSTVKEVTEYLQSLIAAKEVRG